MAFMRCSLWSIYGHGCPMHCSNKPGSHEPEKAQVLRQRFWNCPLELEVHMLRYIPRPDAMISWGDPPPNRLAQSSCHGYIKLGNISCSPPVVSRIPLASQPNLEVHPWLVHSTHTGHLVNFFWHPTLALDPATTHHALSVPYPRQEEMICLLTPYPEVAYGEQVFCKHKY
jgi:hypothetical protein